MRKDTREMIEHELKRARMKFPGRNMNFAALVEEVGEVARSLMNNGTDEKGHANVRKEAVQTAVMAIRVIEEGDETYGYTPD
jgi:hypothetical protein